MSYYPLSNKNDLNPNLVCKKPFITFSDREDRADLMTFGSTSTRRKRSKSTHSSRKRRSGVRRRLKTRVSKVRIVNGKVALRIGGFPGVQKVGASQLVRFVPLNKLRSAAKRALGGARGKRFRRRRRRTRKNKH